MCDELEDDPPKDSSPPDTTNSNTEAMRVVIEEVKSNDSNSTLEDVSSIDDLNTTVNNDFSKNPLPEHNGCCTPEDQSDNDTQNSMFQKEIPMESMDKMLVKLALIEKEKNEELGVTMVPDHIVLTMDEKEKLFEEFETESSETVKIVTVETEDGTEKGFDISSEEEFDDVEEEFSYEDNEPISLSVDERNVEMNDSSKHNEGVAIQYVKNDDGAREFELELSPDCAEFQSGESETSSRRESFEEDANDKLDVKTLDDALELKSVSSSKKMPEPKASSETKNDGWSDSDDEPEMTAKLTAASGDDGWGNSDDEIEQPVVKTKTASIIASGDEKSKVMSDGSLYGDIRERGNIIDENRCSSSWNREKFQKRNRNEFDNRNNNYGSQSRDNQYQQRDGQRDNRQFDKAPGGSNRPRDQNRHGFDRYNRGARDDFGRNDDRRRSFNSDRSFHSHDPRDQSNRNDHSYRGGDRYGDEQGGMRNDRQNNHYHRENNHNRHDNRGDRFDSNESSRNNSYRNNNRGDYNRHYNNGQDSNNNYGGPQRSYDNFNQRKNFLEKENRDSMGVKDGHKHQGGRTPFNRDEHRRSFRDGGRDNGHGGRGPGRTTDSHMDRSEGDNLFGSHDNRNNRRTVRLNPNPSAKITFVNDHCTRGEMDPSDKMRNDLNFNQKEDIENEGW